MPEIHHDQLYDPAAIASAGKAENVGGQRHYEGQGLGPVIQWACPACGKSNSRPLSEGCEWCHSGEGAAKHVGVDPIVRKVEKSSYMVVGTALPNATNIHVTDDSNAAFLGWLAQKRIEMPSIIPLLSEAFVAGWQSYATVLRAGVVMPLDSRDETPQDADATTQATAEPLEGTPEARTIIAALELFRAQVLAEGPEEVGTGEWLGAGEIDRLIEDVKGRYV